MELLGVCTALLPCVTKAIAPCIWSQSTAGKTVARSTPANWLSKGKYSDVHAFHMPGCNTECSLDGDKFRVPAGPSQPCNITPGRRRYSVSVPMHPCLFHAKSPEKNFHLSINKFDMINSYKCRRSLNMGNLTTLYLNRVLPGSHAPHRHSSGQFVFLGGLVCLKEVGISPVKGNPQFCQLMLGTY